VVTFKVKNGGRGGWYIGRGGWEARIYMYFYGCTKTATEDLLTLHIVGCLAFPHFHFKDYILVGKLVAKLFDFFVQSLIR